MNIETYFKISYGLYIVTTQAGNRKGGYIANTLFQVTATPPQFAISCNKDNYTTGLIKESGVFGFSVLSEKASASLIGNFGYKSGRDFDKFAGVNYLPVKPEVPLSQILRWPGLNVRLLSLTKWVPMWFLLVR